MRSVADLRRSVGLSLALIAAMVLTACGSSGGGSSHDTGQAGPAGAPQRGGSLTVLESAAEFGQWPSGLDPATNTSGITNLEQNQAIFGGLFLLVANKDGSNAHVIGNQAASGKLSPDAKTLTIKLRPGIKFSDGTPLNAKAVVWNFERDVKSSCQCAPTWKLAKDNPFETPDPLTVVVHMTAPDAAALHSFPSLNANWIASPAAFKKMGEKAFRIKPVGAGPFTVVSDKLSTELVLERNEHYFKKGLPYLDKLTFKSINGDQAAYQALLAGQGDAYQAMSSPTTIEQAKSSGKLEVTMQPGTSPYLVNINRRHPPFNDIRAREALYYATDWKAISKGVFDGGPKVVQSFSTPADLYYASRVPGYRTYNPDKARQLVKQLGGLKVELMTTSVETAKEVVTALQTQWEKVGMKVTIKPLPLNTKIKRYNTGNWQADLTTDGAWDPAAGKSVGFMFSSDSSVSGGTDPQLDKLIAEGISTSVDSQRAEIYHKIAKYISDKAYGPFGFAFAGATLAVKGVHAPGLTTQIPALFITAGVLWGKAWKEHG